MHVDLAHAALLARGIDEAAQMLAALLRLLDFADDEVAVAGGLVGRGDGDPADAGDLVDQAEIDADVLDPVELDLVDALG